MKMRSVGRNKRTVDLNPASQTEPLRLSYDSISTDPGMMGRRRNYLSIIVVSFK